MRPHIRPNVIVANDFSIDHLLIHDATIHRYAKQRQPGGSYKEVWSAVGSIPCRFTTHSTRFDRDVDSQQETFGTQFKVFAKGDADVRADDRLEFRGVAYEVVNTPIDPSFLGHHLEIQVKLVPKEV